MAFRQAPYCRVAGHLAYRIGIDCEEQRLAAHSRGGEGGLNARMAGTDNDHIVLLWIDEHVFYILTYIKSHYVFVDKDIPISASAGY
jgi:hypothetical protein